MINEQHSQMLMNQLSHEASVEESVRLADAMLQERDR